MWKANPNIGVKYENVQLHQLFVLMKRVAKNKKLFVYSRKFYIYFLCSILKR